MSTFFFKKKIMNTCKEVAQGRLAGTSIHCFCAVEGDDVVRVDDVVDIGGNL
jgi:orotate phosphoribosyltransferase-like protein